MKKFIFLILIFGFSSAYGQNLEVLNNNNLSLNNDVGVIPMKHEDKFYESNTGQKYKYDLSKPIDRVRYNNDPLAKMRDSNQTDPLINVDKDQGQFGGGYINNQKED